jgi:hypothetical protein
MSESPTNKTQFVKTTQYLLPDTARNATERGSIRLTQYLAIQNFQRNGDRWLPLGRSFSDRRRG